MAGEPGIRYECPGPVKSRALLVVFALFPLASLAGCRGCDRDRPFVPYTINSAPSVATTPPVMPTAAVPSAIPGPDGGFARQPAVVAPPGTTTWTVGGVAIAAPAGRVFLSAVALSEPGSVAAWVGDGGSLAAEIVLFKTEGGKVTGPTTLARLPDGMPSGPSCQHMVQLSQIGTQTLFADAVALCKPADPKKPSRWMAALSTSATPAVKLDLRALDIPNGERLVVEADATDRDGDGTDDLSLQIALEGAPSPIATKGSAVVVARYLGRGGGLSREAEEPARSLRLAATWLAAQGAKKNGAEEALGAASRVRRLYEMICTEGGAPLLTLGDGSAFPCDPATVEDTRYAEARALLTMGDPVRAIALGARLRAARPKSKRVAELDAALEAAAPARKAKAKPLTAIPMASSIAVPLAFDGEGRLMILGEDSVVRVDPATAAESPASDVARWSPRADLVGSLRVQGASDPCRADLLRLLIGGDAPREMTLPVVGSAPPACPADPAIPLVLLDRNADGLTVALLGEPVAISADGERATHAAWPSSAPGPGTIRSPDGKWTALAAGDRVLVRGPGKTEIWKPTPFFTLSACTIANDGKAVACTLDRGAVLLTP